MHLTDIAPAPIDQSSERKAEQPDVAVHARTFKLFATGMVLFAAHILLILVVLDLAFRW